MKSSLDSYGEWNSGKIVQLSKGVDLVKRSPGAGFDCDMVAVWELTEVKL